MIQSTLQLVLVLFINTIRSRRFSSHRYGFLMRTVDTIGRAYSMERNLIPGSTYGVPKHTALQYYYVARILGP